MAHLRRPQWFVFGRAEQPLGSRPALRASRAPPQRSALQASPLERAGPSRRYVRTARTWIGRFLSRPADLNDGSPDYLAFQNLLDRRFDVVQSNCRCEFIELLKMPFVAELSPDLRAAIQRQHRRADAGQNNAAEYERVHGQLQIGASHETAGSDDAIGLRFANDCCERIAPNGIHRSRPAC